MSDSAASSRAVAPRLAAEVRYPLPQLLAEIRAEGIGQTLGQDHLSQKAVQTLFKAYRSRRERPRK